MGDIILFFIGLFIWCFIGVAAAYEKVILYDFATVIGVWYAIYLFVVAPFWAAIVYFIVYCIVTIGTMLTWGGK